MSRILCTLLVSVTSVAVLSLGCDPQEQAAATAGPAAAKGDKSTAPASPAAGDAHASAGGEAAPATGAAAAPTTFAGLSECLVSCEAPGMIATNRETCKLNCDTAYGAQPAAAGAGADPVGKAASCLGRCYLADTSSEACASDCKTVAARTTPGPAPDVLDRLGTCIRTCHTDKTVTATNRATCELNCTQTARVAGPAPTATPTK